MEGLAAKEVHRAQNVIDRLERELKGKGSVIRPTSDRPDWETTRLHQIVTYTVQRASERNVIERLFEARGIREESRVVLARTRRVVLGGPFLIGATAR